MVISLFSRFWYPLSILPADILNMPTVSKNKPIAKPKAKVNFRERLRFRHRIDLVAIGYSP
jgi:hypothetical protein